MAVQGCPRRPADSGRYGSPALAVLALSACSAIMGNVEDVRAIEFTDTDAWTYADYVTVTPERGEPLTVHLPGAEGFAEALTTQWEKVRAQR